jgi:hypothetical protein
MKRCEGSIGVRNRFSRPSGAGAGPNNARAARFDKKARRADQLAPATLLTETRSLASSTVSSREWTRFRWRSSRYSGLLSSIV